MLNKSESIFSSTKTLESVFASIEKAVSEHNMLEKLMGGVLVGLSGGADSVMLLLYLAELRKKHGSFQILAVHINHMIRGDEADRDAEFSKELSAKLGIPFICSKIDVPKIASKSGLSLEEAARNVRYSEFQRIIEGRNDISCIALAHNATDNIETALFNMIRGAGTKGASGIPPVRDNIVRPLIYASKKDIVSALESSQIVYMTDSTNAEDDYSRNYVRNNILPHLYHLASDPERSFLRLSKNLRADEEYISDQAEAILHGRKTIKNSELLSMHRSLLFRVLSKMASEYSITLEHSHVEAIVSCLGKENFEVSLPNQVRFVSERGVSYITNAPKEDIKYLFYINEGENHIPEYNSAIYITDEKVNKNFLNVYKKSIQADLSSAIICGRLFVRPKQDGDSVFYGGMTHKLKKLFNDRKIPLSERQLIPILCDDNGVVWVPGFGVRDDKNDNSSGKVYVTLAINDVTPEDGLSFCFAKHNKQYK